MTSLEPGDYLISTLGSNDLYFLITPYLGEYGQGRDVTYLDFESSTYPNRLFGRHKIFTYDGQRLFSTIGKQKFYLYLHDEDDIKGVRLATMPTLDDRSLAVLTTDGKLKLNNYFVSPNTSYLFFTIEEDTPPQTFQFTRINSKQNYLNKILERVAELNINDKINVCSGKDIDTKINVYDSEICQQEMKNPDFYKSVKEMYCRIYDNPELCECNPEIATYDFNSNICKCNDKNLIYDNGKCVEPPKPPKVDDNLEKSESPVGIVILIVAAVLLLLWYTNRK